MNMMNMRTKYLISPILAFLVFAFVSILSVPHAAARRTPCVASLHSQWTIRN